MAKTKLPQPLVLVVDDNEEALDIATEAFSDQECTVIKVTEPEDAIRQLRASPGVDLVYTDVKLRPRQGDTSGIFLGDFVKAERPDVPVAVYSINFREEELSSALRQVAASQFDLVLPRGGSADADFVKQIKQCVELAKRFRDARFAAAASQAATQRRAEPSFSVMREFVIAGDAPSQAEEVLRAKGYSLRILSLRFDDDEHHALAVWLLEHEGQFAAEVYQCPQLHAAGRTAEQALSRLVTAVEKAPESVFRYGEDEQAISRLLLQLGTPPRSRKG